MNTQQLNYPITNNDITGINLTYEMRKKTQGYWMKYPSTHHHVEIPSVRARMCLSRNTVLELLYNSSASCKLILTCDKRD